MSEPPPVDLVVTAGHVLCMDGPEPVIDDGAVAVRDGGIVAVGPAADVLARHRGAEVVPLPGHALLPGFVNAHTHLAMTMFRGMADDRNLDAFLATVMPVEGRVLTEDRVHRATRAVAVESVCAGVTTVLDMYFFVDAALAAADQVGMRVLSGPVMFDGGAGPLAWDPLMDWAQRWLAAHPARAGWRPVVGPHSTYTVSPAHLAEVRDLAAAHGASGAHPRRGSRRARTSWSGACTANGRWPCWRTSGSWPRAPCWPMRCTWTTPSWPRWWPGGPPWRTARHPT